MSEDPQRIIVAADWHGNTDWALYVIGMAADRLRDEQTRIILHLGDFGIWPGDAGEEYLRRVREALNAAGISLWFIDGNHEDFTQLEDLRIWEGRAVNWLPRGHRWAWYGRTWLALGGGVSLDKAIRRRGKSWWPEEEITHDQAAAVIEDGHADVMVTHDCPAGVKHTFPPPPTFWDLRDIARSDTHQERLQRVMDAVQPSHLMHGHLHRSYQRVCEFGYGPVEVTGLDCDEGDGVNWAVLDVKSMTWEA